MWLLSNKYITDQWNASSNTFKKAAILEQQSALIYNSAVNQCTCTYRGALQELALWKHQTVSHIEAQTWASPEWLPFAPSMCWRRNLQYILLSEHSCRSLRSPILVSTDSSALCIDCSAYIRSSSSTRMFEYLLASLRILPIGQFFSSCCFHVHWCDS